MNELIKAIVLNAIDSGLTPERTLTDEVAELLGMDTHNLAPSDRLVASAVAVVGAAFIAEILSGPDTNRNHSQ